MQYIVDGFSTVDLYDHVRFAEPIQRLWILQLVGNVCRVAVNSPPAVQLMLYMLFDGN